LVALAVGAPAGAAHESVLDPRPGRASTRTAPVASSSRNVSSAGAGAASLDWPARSSNPYSRFHPDGTDVRSARVAAYATASGSDVSKTSTPASIASRAPRAGTRCSTSDGPASATTDSRCTVSPTRSDTRYAPRSLSHAAMESGASVTATSSDAGMGARGGTTGAPGCEQPASATKKAVRLAVRARITDRAWWRAVSRKSYLLFLRTSRRRSSLLGRALADARPNVPGRPRATLAYPVGRPCRAPQGRRGGAV